MDNPENHVVEIVKSLIQGERNKTSKSFVIPGAFHANRKEKITWTAIGIGARILFPKSELFGTNGFTLKAGESRVETVSPKAKRNVYPYVVITDDGDIAIGGSFPIIIID